jgi:uncharacterized repeat protein (TIGR01451 family)
MSADPAGPGNPTRTTQTIDTKQRINKAAVVAGPAPAAGPTITASKTDGIPNATAVNPGDTISYSITITNTGADATNVTLQDTVDPNTTIVNGSAHATPIGVNDSYNVLGNVRISVPDGLSDLLANDVDPDTGNNAGLTITTLGGDNSAPFTGTSNQGGQVTATTGDGSFQYNPPAGFQGTDSFTYTVSDPNGGTSSQTVTLAVNGMIWFVNAAAPGGGDGRLTSPFNCLVGPGCFDPAAADNPGDNIFLFSGSYADAAALTLLSTQKLVGQGATETLATITGVTVPVNSDALPATGGASPTITSTANAINLGSGNTLRGFTIGNSTGSKIFGNIFGTATIGNNSLPDVLLNGSGQALNLTNGTFAATSAFSGVTTTSSTAQGILLTQVAGTISFGSTTVSSPNGQGILVTQSTANIAFGNTSVSGGTDAISLQNNSAGTRSFGTLTTLNNSAVGLLHAVGGGATTAVTTNITNPGTRGIDIENSTTAVSLGNTNVSQSGSTGVFISGSSGAVTFGDLDISPDAGVRALQATQNTGAITTTSGTIVTTDGVSDFPAVEIVGTNSATRTPLNVSLTTVTVGGTPTNGIILTNTSSTGSPGGFHILGNTSGICGGSVTNTTTPGIPATVTAGNTADCSGGTISNTSGDAIRLQSVENVSLTRVQITNSAQSGIFGTEVNGFELISSFISNNGNNVGEEGLRFTDVTNPGSANGLIGSSLVGQFPTRIINTTVRQSGEFNVEIVNRSGVLTDLLVDGSQFTDTNLNAGPADADGFNVEMQNTATGTVRLQNSFFSNNFTQGAQLSAIDSGTLTASVASSTFTSNNEGFVCNHAQSSDLICTVGGDATSQGNTFQNHPGSSIVLSTSSTATASASLTGKVKSNSVTSAANPVNHGVIAFLSGTNTPASVNISNNTVTQTVFGHAILIDTPDAGSTPQFSVTANNNFVTNNAIGGHGVLVQNRQAGSSACVLIQNNLGTVDAASSVARVRQVGTATFNLKQGVSNSANASVVMQQNNPGVTTTAVGTINVVSNAACTTPAQLTEFISEQSATRVNTPNPELLNQAIVIGPVSSSSPEETVTDMQSPSASVKATRGTTLRTARKRRNFDNLLGGRYSTTDSWLTGVQFLPSAQKQKGRINVPRIEVTANPPVIAGGVLTWNVGTLPSGQSVTITFQVQVNNPFNGPGQVSNQGTVTADGGISVLTDDPDVGGATDATITLVNAPPNVAVQDAKVAEPTSGSTNMLFTVVLSKPAPASGVTVDFATAAGGATPATAGSDYTATSGTLSFASGDQIKTIAVPVLADADNAESDETLLLNLSNATGANITDNQAIGTITVSNAPGTLLISELRTSGPGGADDDFVELYNNTDTPLTVTAVDASAGYGLFKMGADCNATPILIATIPNGTLIPARGHYLLVGSAYSLGTNAAGDQTLTANIENDANVAVFSTSDTANLSTVTRLDAVGFGSNSGGGACDLLREGTNLPAIAGSLLEYSFQRDACGKGGNPALMGICPSQGMAVDNNNNTTDFIFADTTATNTVAGQHLGAPGPENLSSPINRNSSIGAVLLDSTKTASSAPNRVRDLTNSAPPNTNNGTMTIRRRFINNTGANVTRLRFRIVDISSTPTPAGIADLRALTSVDTSVTGVTDAATCLASTGSAVTPCSVTVAGTTLEEPPAQAMGGGLNATMAVGTITLATPLASGASINVQFLLGVQQTGTFKFYVNIEALP